MAEILSQDEIDSLLEAIATGDDDSSKYENTSSSSKEQKSVKIYDFRRPDKFSKDHLRTLQMMHETFARLTTTALSAQLRALVSVHVASVDQLTYEEFIKSIPVTTTMAVVNMDPLKGSSVLEIDPTITFTIIDKLFGGVGESAKTSRELTDIELSVMEGIIVRILGNLREAWSNVLDLRPRLGNIETNPQFAQIVPPTDMVVLVTLETKVGDVEGMINLCIPYITIEPIISKLSAQYMYSSTRKGATEENLAIIQNRMENVVLPVVAEIGEAQITVQEVLALGLGDVIKLPDTKIGDDMIVKIGGRRKYKCRPGLIHKRVAVKLGEKIDEIPDELLTINRREDEF